MILKEDLRKIIKSQRENLALLGEGIEREALKQMDMKIPFALVLSGIRRCGKSTLLRQLMKNVNGFYYFNFEDPRTVNLEISDFQKMDEIFSEEYGNQNHYFFDEVQNLTKWELMVRAILDKKKHAVITGSNASLLSKELGTRLTGRHIRYELFPFSYREFLILTNGKPNLSSFEEYFTRGGFPEYLKVKMAEILQELLNDIITRDIAVRYRIRSLKTIKEMALYLLTNIGKEFSYNALKKTFNLGSVNSAISFVSYFQDSYLLFAVPKFEYSLKRQLINPKKMYSIDNGLSSINSASFSEDKGKMLENLVFVSLRREYKDIFYFRENKECDFVVKKGAKVKELIQVCYELNDDNQEREVNGLMEALEKFNLNKGLILTYKQEDELIIKNKKIKVLPVWKWLIE